MFGGLGDADQKVHVVIGVSKKIREPDHAVIGVSFFADESSFERVWRSPIPRPGGAGPEANAT